MLCTQDLHILFNTFDKDNRLVMGEHPCLQKYFAVFNFDLFRISMQAFTACFLLLDVFVPSISPLLLN